MKQKLILVTLIVFLTVVSQNTFSLGLKEIQVKSGLNQPLKATVDLMVGDDEDISDLKVALADAQSYKKVGLDKSFVPSGIQVELDKDNPRQINVSSNAPITEPIVSLLLDVNWENGKILREFTVLLDPPVYNAAENVVINKISTPRFVEPQAEQEPVEQEPEVVVELSEREADYADETEFVDAKPAEEVVEMVEHKTTYEGFGEIEVMPGDTLWSLAQSNKPSEVTTQQMIEALFNKNPDAFADNNINRLIKGRRLSVPTLNEIQAISQADALDLMRSHNNAWQPAQSDDSYSALQTSEPTEQPVTETKVEQDYGVELMGGDDQKEHSGDSEDGGNTNNLSENAVAEELYNKASENQELKERLSELEDLVEQQQEALEIKSDDLSNLQDQLGSEQDQALDTLAESVEADDIWGDEGTVAEDPLLDIQDTVAEAAVDEAQQLAVDEIDALSQIPEGDGLIDGETTDALADEFADQTIDEFADDLQVDDSEAEVAVAKEETKQETQKQAGDESTVDQSVNWVMDNLRWILGGLVALILLLFVPKFFKSKGNKVEEEGSFLDDIKSKEETPVDEVREQSDDAVDTKLTEPLTEQVEDLQQEAEQQLEDSSAVFEGESVFEEAEVLEEGSDDVQQNEEDEFDLDGFLNEEKQPEEEPVVEQETDQTTEEEDDFEFDLSEFDDLEKETGISDIEQEVEQKVDDVEELAEGLSDDLESKAEEAVFDLDDDIAELESEFGLEGLHDLGEVDELDVAKTEQDGDSLDISSLEDELDLGDEQQSKADEAGTIDDSFDLPDNNETEDEIMIDDEDFDLGIDLDDMMEDQDAIDVKFDLAKAYLEMGDSDGAKNLLKEVVSEGSPELVEQAKKLLDEM